jgi:chromosome segregation ATPase
MTMIFKDHAEEPRDIEARLSRLEAASDAHAAKISDHGGLLVSMDDDLSKIQVEFRAQRGKLQALHDTQSEHSTQLRQHTALLDKHTSILNEHTSILNEHTSILNEHTSILNEHTAILSDHGGQLAEIRVGVQTIIDLLTPRPGSEN